VWAAPHHATLTETSLTQNPQIFRCFQTH
jgi:hypothetical protein